MLSPASLILHPGGWLPPEGARVAFWTRIFDPGVDPVGRINVIRLPGPAPGAGGPAGSPQAVPPAVPGPGQREPRAGVRPLAAREDPHRGGPGPELASAQQPGSAR